MSKMVGIDLGTTNSLVATVDSGIPFVIAGAHGSNRKVAGECPPNIKTEKPVAISSQLL